MWSSNLRQHIARDHTKEFLYTCQKCNKGFYTSPEATAHRKLCYPKNVTNNPEEDMNEGGKGNEGETGDGEKGGNGDGDGTKKGKGGDNGDDNE